MGLWEPLMIAGHASHSLCWWLAVEVTRLSCGPASSIWGAAADWSESEDTQVISAGAAAAELFLVWGKPLHSRGHRHVCVVGEGNMTLYFLPYLQSWILILLPCQLSCYLVLTHILVYNSWAGIMRNWCLWKSEELEKKSRTVLMLLYVYVNPL